MGGWKVHQPRGKRDKPFTTAPCLVHIGGKCGLAIGRDAHLILSFWTSWSSCGLAGCGHQEPLTNQPSNVRGMGADGCVKKLSKSSHCDCYHTTSVDFLITRSWYPRLPKVARPHPLGPMATPVSPPLALGFPFPTSTLDSHNRTEVVRRPLIDIPTAAPFWLINASTHPPARPRAGLGCQRCAHTSALYNWLN